HDARRPRGGERGERSARGAAEDRDAQEHRGRGGVRARARRRERRRPREGIARHAHGARRARARRGGGGVIYYFLYPLSEHPSLSFLNVLRYVPFRAIAAALTAVIVTFGLYPWFIRRLQKRQIGQ